METRTLSKKFFYPLVIALLLSFGNNAIEAACQYLHACSHPGCGSSGNGPTGCGDANACYSGACKTGLFYSTSGYSVSCNKIYRSGCPAGKECVNDSCVPVTPPPTPPPVTPPPVTPPPVVEPTAGVEEDPIIKGFRGQMFKFHGRSEAWYAILTTNSLQWNNKFFEYPKCTRNVEGEYRNIEDRMFVTATSVHLPSIDQKISVEITTLNKQSPGCPEGKPNCLGNGTIALFIDGEMYDAPGEHNLKDGGRVIVHNFDWMCAHVQGDHFTEQTDKEFFKNKKKNDKDFLLLNKKKRPYQSTHRRLSEEEIEQSQDTVRDQEIAIDLLLDKAHTKGVNDSKECRKWLKDREYAKDLFDQPGKWSIFHIKTSLLSLRLEYLYVEEEGRLGGTCHLRHLNTYVEKISPGLYNDGQWTGVAGETRYEKYTYYGSTIKKNRYQVLSSPFDEDYEVEGPFHTDFVARHVDVSYTDDEVSI